MKNTITFLVLLFLLASAFTIAYAATVFDEDFNSLVSGTSITTLNTNFDYVRIGSGGGGITAEVTPGNESHMRIGGSSSGSLNGVGLQSSLGGSNLLTINFRLNLEDTNGDLFIGAGSGGTFTTNATFATADLMFAFQSNNGNLEYRTTSWNSMGQSLSSGVNYEFHIVVNRSGNTVAYGAFSVADDSMDMFVNGSLLGDDLPITNNQNATGFRIYQINGGHYARIDSISIDDTALPPFTPTALTLHHLTALSQPGNEWVAFLALFVLAGLAGFAWVRNRRRAPG